MLAGVHPDSIPRLYRHHLIELQVGPNFRFRLPRHRLDSPTISATAREASSRTSHLTACATASSVSSTCHPGGSHAWGKFFSWLARLSTRRLRFADCGLALEGGSADYPAFCGIEVSGTRMEAFPVHRGGGNLAKPQQTILVSRTLLLVVPLFNSKKINVGDVLAASPCNESLGEFDSCNLALVWRCSVDAR